MRPTTLGVTAGVSNTRTPWGP